MKRFVIIASLLLSCSVVPASANVLRGMVRDIHDGKTISVENTGRLIKVTLKGADAPEQDQPYGDIALKHLSDLVLNQEVAVELRGLGAGSVLIGKVVCGNRDIGLQMIRDGVAWFNRSYESELSETDRRLYADSEQAARNEHRGIWRDPSPVSPWEWRNAKANLKTPAVVNAVKKPAVTSPAPSPTPVRNFSAPASDSPATTAGSSKRPFYSPPGAPFSSRLPQGGQSYTAEIAVPEAGPINANFYWVHHLKIGYLAVWASGPKQDETISALFDKALDALNNAAAASGLPCEFFQEKDAMMGGYTGRRYKVRGCYFHGGLRYYFKTEGKTLKMRIVGVMSEVANDPAVSEFLDSFEIIN